MSDFPTVIHRAIFAFPSLPPTTTISPFACRLQCTPSLSHAIQLWCLCNAIDFDVMHAVMACILHTTEPLLPSSQFSIQSHHQLFILFQFHSQFPPHSHSHCFLYFHNHSCRYRGHYLSLWEVVFCVYRELDSCR